VSPSLTRIVGAYTVNQLGWWFALVALSLGVYNHTHSTPAVAAVLVFAVLPALFAPAVVARVEASPRRGGLSVLYAIQGASAVALAAVLWQFSLPAIVLFVAVDGSVAYAARALVRSEAARAGGIHRANAALNVSLAVCSVTGPVLAGLVVEGFGAPVALLIDAASFLASGILLVDLRPHVQEAATSVRARVTAAREFLHSERRVRALVLTQAVALVFFTCAIPVEVAFARSTLRAGDVGYSVLLATWGVGQIAGSIVFARASRWIWPMLVAGTLAVGLAYIGLAAAPSLAVACLAALPGGLGNGVQWAAFIGVVQELTPGRLLGRIMGVIEGMRSVAPVLGYLLGGVLALVSLRGALLVAGILASVVTIPFLRIGAWRSPADVGVAAAAESAQPQPGVPGVAP
jgi:MFS family permease